MTIRPHTLPLVSALCRELINDPACPADTLFGVSDDLRAAARDAASHDSRLVAIRLGQMAIELSDAATARVRP